MFVEELTKSVLESGLLREEVDRYVLDRALPPFAMTDNLNLPELELAVCLLECVMAHRRASRLRGSSRKAALA